MPTPPLQIDERYLDYATPRQREILEAVIAAGSASAADAMLKIGKGTASDVYKSVKARATHRGFSPDHDMTRTVPEGYKVKGVSTYYNAEGKVTGQWLKSSADDEARFKAIEAAAKAMAADIPPADPVTQNGFGMADLLTLYTLTDAHIGMLAWEREGGANWDLKIAEDTIVGCFALAIQGAPKAQTAILNQLGDLLHYDGLSAVTPTSGHVLDADGRFTKMVEVSVRVLRRLIAMMLKKHDAVHLILAEGNHDIAGSVWLRTMFKALYENEPRITVDDSALPYYCHVFGNVMNVFHHSHLSKSKQLAAKIPALFPKEWGATTKRYCHTGNYHHEKTEDADGVKMIQHPTLAARDAYAARGPWFAERNMSAITYHRSYGQAGTATYSPEMVAA